MLLLTTRKWVEMTCISSKSFLSSLWGEFHCYSAQCNQIREVAAHLQGCKRMWMGLHNATVCHPLYYWIICNHSHIDFKLHRKIFPVMLPPEVSLGRNDLETKDKLPLLYEKSRWHGIILWRWNLKQNKTEKKRKEKKKTINWLIEHHPPFPPTCRISFPC